MALLENKKSYNYYYTASKPYQGVRISDIGSLKHWFFSGQRILFIFANLVFLFWAHFLLLFFAHGGFLSFTR